MNRFGTQVHSSARGHIRNREPMKKKSVAFVTAFLLCGCATFLVAQDGQPLMEQLERVTKEKEPQWTLDRKLPSDMMVVLRWSSGEARVFMSITVADSTAKAKDIYLSSVATLSAQLA